jgi:hypothetical protein
MPGEATPFLSYSHVSEDVILKVGQIEREWGHWQGWLDFVEQSPPSLDAQSPDGFRIPLQAAVALFAEAVDVAYRAVADEMSSVRRRQETPSGLV